MNYKAFFDGCCEPKNPGGNMGFGAAIFKDSVQVETLSQYVPANKNNSNNVAEYQAFGWTAKKLLEVVKAGEVVEIFGDSKLVVEQMNGRWGIKEGFYTQYAKRALVIVKELRTKCKLSITWIPREKNGIADDLSKTPMLKAGIEFKLQKA